MDMKNELEKYQLLMYKQLLKDFTKNEIRRFEDGYEVYDTEISKTKNINGITIYGVIDRVDKKDDFFEIIDYKTGSIKLSTKNNYENSTDFQLEFYYLLASKSGDTTRCGFYDLKDIKIVSEPFLEQKLGVLESNIKDLLKLDEINFTKCENIKDCVYCDYKMICQREF